MFYANFKPKPLSLLGFLLRFGLNSVTFNTEKTSPPLKELVLPFFDFSNQFAVLLASYHCVPDFHTS